MGNTPKIKKQDDRRTVRPATGGTPARSWTRWIVGGGIAAALVLLVVFVSQDVSSNPQGTAEPPAGTEEFTIGDVSHTSDTVAYAQTPPVGGSHDAEWLACGVYEQPVRNENAVHALEHGAVWITYTPGLDEGQRSVLEGFGRRSEVIVSPYPGMDSPIVLSTWGRQLRLDTADETVIDQFIRAFKNRTAPENNAGC